MRLVRHYLNSYPRLVGMFLVAVLALKLLVPTGYMIAPDSKSFTVQICTGMGMVEKTVTVSVDSHSSEKSDRQASDKPCSFAGFAQLVLSAADPVLLIAALLFIMITALHVQSVSRVSARSRLRPPLRAPPAIA